MAPKKTKKKLPDDIIADSPLIIFDENDPFIDGAGGHCGVLVEHPYRLGHGEKKAKEILASYITRASGGCRLDLASKAEKVLEKLKG